MNKKYLEWFRQADYDIETAEFMFNGGRYFYSIFMCHLSIEKALKGLYQLKLEQVPPKTHNLIYLLDKMGIMPGETMGKFMVKLNEANITTRYPDDLAALQRNYTEETTDVMLENTREALAWIKQQS